MPRNDALESEPTEPITVGNYVLEKTIGKGSYGKVKLGFHRETGEKFAVKVIEKNRLKSQKQVTRLQREIRFLKLLHHPHIIKVYDVIETNENIFIMMEYAKGGELFDYIVANKRVKEQEARSFFRQVLSAVDYCHQNAVIHRDLKPENLLLDERKNIKIIDFGFGNNFSADGKLLDTFCGSPYYAAPEMILGKKYEGPEVDMWSLGVIMFALLCGHLPFDDDDIQVLYKKIASGTYISPDYLMPNARHLIGRLITVDPKQRATLKEVFEHPWVTEGYNSKPPSYVPERPIITDPRMLSPDIIRRLHAFGYKEDDIIKAFSPNMNFEKPNPVRATYFLLLEMLQREEIKLQKRNQSYKPLVVTNKDDKPALHSPTGPDTAPAALEAAYKNDPSRVFASMTDMAPPLPLLETNMRQPNPNERRASMPAFPEIPRRASMSRMKDEIKALSGWFLNVSLNSTKPLDQIVEEVQRVLQLLSISYRQEKTLFVCVADIQKMMIKEEERHGPTVQFQIELVLDKGKHGLHFKRIQGGVWNYKKICNKMLAEMRL